MKPARPLWKQTIVDLVKNGSQIPEWSFYSLEGGRTYRFKDPERFMEFIKNYVPYTDPIADDPRGVSVLKGKRDLKVQQFSNNFLKKNILKLLKHNLHLVPLPMFNCSVQKSCELLPLLKL